MSQVSLGLFMPSTRKKPRMPRAKSALEWGVFAEENGYDSIWLSEGWGTDSFVDLATIAAHTETITLGTSIIPVYYHTPATLSMAGATLQDTSDERFRLGLGAGHPGMVEGIHGIKFENPARRLHETAELVKLLSGESGSDAVSYNGKMFSVDDVPAFDSPFPVYAAALGNATRRATGRVADGWIPYNIPFSLLENRFEVIAKTARDAGRDPDEITVAPLVPAAVSNDPAEARDEIRYSIARYIGDHEDDAYKNAVGELFPRKVDEIEHLWESGEQEEATDQVTNEMVEALGIAGTPDSAREQLRELVETTILDIPIVKVPRSAGNGVLEETITQLGKIN